MNPEERKAPKLSSLKRTNAAIKRAIRKQEAILLLKVEQKALITAHQDLVDFNAGRIHGSPEEFSPKLREAAEKKRRLDEAQGIYRS